ncbi:MAG: UvrD-helicase domain-containing protein [Panacagrimonas sp.]
MTPSLPDAAAREAALNLDEHVLVMAPAGSGKTGLLVHRMLRALAAVEHPEQVVAITFTNKAAAEIRARVLDSLRDAQAGIEPADAHAQNLLASARAVLDRDTKRGWNLLSQPGRLNALTIDAFCAQLGAQLPLLSGLGGAIAVAEDARPLYLDAITQLFGEIEDGSVLAEDRAALGRVLRLYANRIDRLIDPLAGLLARREQWKRPEFREGFEQADEPALRALIEPVLAAFGRDLSDADRAELVGILREGSAQSDKLAWAAELRAWPDGGAAQLALVRAIAGTLLTTEGKLRKPGGINVKSGFVARQAYTERFKRWLEAQQGNDALADCAARVCQLPDKEMPEELRRLRRDWLRVLWRLAAHLRVSFAQAQQADFAQLAESALDALRPEGGYGDALLAADHRIRHLLVDEMQDTSETQVELLQRLTAGWVQGDGRSLFLVGDPQQSIYAFRKAEVRLFLKLWEQRAIGELPLHTLRLSANFRSRPAVVNWFNEAFARIFPPTPDVLRGSVPFTPSVALRGAEEGTGVRVDVFDSIEAEAGAVADEAARRIESDNSVAVLARTRSSLEPVIRALRARGLTPACQDLDPLAALPEVRDLIALARALWHPEDRLSWAIVLRAPFVGLGWADLVALSRGRVRTSWPARVERALIEDPGLSVDGRLRLQRLVDALDASTKIASLHVDLAARTESVWHALNGPAACSRAALDDVRQALRCLREETRGGGIRDLAKLERRLAELYAAPRAGQIQMMTVHKAKGLEFDHVLLVGLNRGARSEDKPPLHLAEIGGQRWCVPRPDEAWPEEHAAHRLYDALHALAVANRRNEALRLLYVAVTRARRTATLFACIGRDENGTIKLARDSFASLLEPVIAAELGRVPASGEPVSEAEPDRDPPRAPRLPLDIQLVTDAGLYRPIETRTAKPSEAVLASAEEPEARRDEGDVYAQLLGTLYHEAMQRIAAEGFETWRDGGESRRHSMAAGLRRRGMPEPLVAPAVARVIDLLKRTLAADTGRWLIAPRNWARSEYPLAGWRDGRWISAVIDRCFEDEDGVLWVIDYKTSARPIDAAFVESYVAEGVEKYRHQVGEYVRLLAGLRPGREIRGALYFAEADRLVFT